MGLAKRLWSTFIDWCKETSIAGLGKGVSSKSNVKKAYWIILFLIGTYYTILNVIVTFQDYFQYEVTTDTALSFEKSVPFPAISICNLNRWTLSNNFREINFQVLISTISIKGSLQKFDSRNGKNLEPNSEYDWIWWWI